MFLKYAELFGAKYAGKYAEFGEICGAYMRHNAALCRICAAYFPHIFGKGYATSSDGES